MSTYWWTRTSRFAAGELEAVIVSLDSALATGDCELLRELVWDLHCAGIRVAAVTSETGASVRRAVRDLLGDGAVELVLTGDDVHCATRDPEIYHYALWELGVGAENALAVEDSPEGLRAAASAGLAAVTATDSLSVGCCKRARKQWGESAVAASQRQTLISR